MDSHHSTFLLTNVILLVRKRLAPKKFLGVLEIPYRNFMVGKHPIIPPVKRTYHKIYPDFFIG